VAADIFVGLAGLTKEATGRPAKILPARGSYKRKARLPPKK